MTVFLLFECVIKNLVKDGILTLPTGTWKKTAIGTQFYYADFFHADTNSLVSFRISVINGNHVISTTAFINQSRFYNIDPTKILNECELK